MASGARSRFEETKRAVARLHEVQLMIMNGCEDWQPPSIKSKGRISDPTAGRAIRNVDVLEAKLATLRAEETELIEFIGGALVIIRAVREGFGNKYADLLEWRYIDCLTWDHISSEYGVKRRAGSYWINIAFDWIDSIGMTRIMAGDLEI